MRKFSLQRREKRISVLEEEKRAEVHSYYQKEKGQLREGKGSDSATRGQKSVIRRGAFTAAKVLVLREKNQRTKRGKLLYRKRDDCNKYQ